MDPFPHSLLSTREKSHIMPTVGQGLYSPLGLRV